MPLSLFTFLPTFFTTVVEKPVFSPELTFVITMCSVAYALAGFTVGSLALTAFQSLPLSKRQSLLGTFAAIMFVALLTALSVASTELHGSHYCLFNGVVLPMVIGTTLALILVYRLSPH